MKRHFKFLESVCFRIVPVLAMLIAAVSAHAGSIVNTKHNLSVSGPGTIKATTQTDICIFCHTPHRAISDSDGPLWNHNTSAANYTVYSSPSMDATVEQPNGASKLCLSCHDGTVALGSVHSRSAPIDMQGGVTTMPAGPSNVGTDLSQDHPISFTYDAGLAAQDGNLVDPSTLTGKVRLDGNSRMQCTACHNPHDDQYGNFLVMDASGSALCNTCHTPPMGGSSHATSTASLESLGTSAVVQRKALASSKGSGQKRTAKQPKTVGANGCANCHGSHGSGARKELLLTKREEQTCFTCHNGSVVQENLVPEFSKPSVHPVLETSHLHSSGEDSVNNARHVACSDCHNTHASKRMGKSGNGISGALLNVNGVSRTGAAVEEAKQEYELCFRCHADTAGQDKPTVPRFTQTTNTRMEFNPSNRSYHPVVQAGKNNNVPSLIAPYTPGATIQCTSCHNNDQGPGAGGSGPKGPHGSVFEPLLERQLITVDHTPESAASYALCYKCHNRDSILSDQSFRALSADGRDRGHRFHVVEQQTACTTCHDSHGVANNAHLINFNPDYVSGGPKGRPEYKSTGPFRGNCTLTCHGHDHVEASYPENVTANPMRARGRRR